MLAVSRVICDQSGAMSIGSQREFSGLDPARHAVELAAGPGDCLAALQNGCYDDRSLNLAPWQSGPPTKRWGKFRAPADDCDRLDNVSPVAMPPRLKSMMSDRH
jgi:hypothetical protein